MVDPSHSSLVFTKMIRQKFYQHMESSPIYSIIITLCWECTRKQEKYNLVETPKEHKTDLWLSRMSSFVSVVGVYVGLPNELSIYLYINHQKSPDFNTKTMVNKSCGQQCQENKQPSLTSVKWFPKKGQSHMAHICGGIKSAIGIRVSNNLISNNNTDINIHDTIRWQIVRNYDCH